MALHDVLRRSFRAQILTLLAAAAYFQASGVAHLVGSKLVGRDSHFPSSEADRASGTPWPHGPGATDEHATSARWILERNPFDSVTPRPLGAPPVPAGAASVQSEHDENVPVCLDVKAVIVVAARDPAWSLAALIATGAAHPKVVRVGDDLGGGRKVELVAWNHVVVSDGSRSCQANMFQPDQPDTTAAASPSGKVDVGAAVARREAPVPPDIASKIRRIGKSEFRIDREVVDRILRNPAELMQAVRIVPEQENGRVAGMRLLGIRPDALLCTLGLENGDRLRSINGFDLSSPETALEAYARLRTADHVVLEVSRRGQNQSLDFDIR
jgi:general secretion pathway protein C